MNLAGANASLKFAESPIKAELSQIDNNRIVEEDINEEATNQSAMQANNTSLEGGEA